MSVLQEIKDGVHALEAKIEGALSGETAKAEGAVGTEVAKVEETAKADAGAAVTTGEADVAKAEQAVVAVVETNWKALVVEAKTFLAEIKQRFPGDAVFNDAQAFIKKVEALL